MKTYKEQIGELKDLLREGAVIGAIEQLLAWDQWTGMPAGAIQFRTETVKYVSGLTSAHFTGPRAQALAKYFGEADLAGIECIYERGAVRKFLRQYKQYNSIPPGLVMEFAGLSSEAQTKWVEAVSNSDFNILKPSVKQLFAMKTEMAKHLGGEDILETMMQIYDEGVSIDEWKTEAEKVKIAVKRLLNRIRESGKTIDDSFLLKEFDKKELFEFAKYIAQAAGYDPGKGGFGQVPHPFASQLGPKDARMTTNCETYSFGVLAALHEAGHAMYGYGGDAETDDYSLFGGIHGGFHEGQSRFYENIIGRSKPFWSCHYHEAQKRFPQFGGVSLDDYYAAINKVSMNIRRIHADEVSYCLHPILRVELEAELIYGQLSFDDLPEAWNTKYREYLGICPEGDADGVLQDVHWSMGLIGYFQSYALGNMYSGQIIGVVKEALPDLDAQLESGDITHLNRWMYENIWHYGCVFTAGELIERVSGGPLNADHYIAYLEEKFGALYSL